MEIKVGEYIKTVAGYIGKIINFDDGMYTAQMKDATIDLYIDDIKNHKENIKDLVQAGDIVLYKLYESSKFYDIGLVKEYEIATTEGKVQKLLGINGFGIENAIIKEILTKEQYEKKKYIVGDESNVKD